MLFKVIQIISNQLCFNDILLISISNISNKLYQCTSSNNNVWVNGLDKYGGSRTCRI